ncbi:MAG: hydantoinase/carbamoylase family amidase [Chloroflexota bacterium]
MKFAVDADKLTEQLLQLATFSEPTNHPDGVTRRVFSPEHRAGRNYLQSLLDEAEIPYHENASGVLIARLETEGCDSSLPAVATGSHIDAIPESGRFDGTVGTLGGLAALVAIKQSGVKLRRAIELLDFSEEPTVFGVGCLQSRLMSGFLAPVDSEALIAEDGQTTFKEICLQHDLNGSFSDVVLPKGHYAGWVELHIEQGPRLELAGIPIGVVSNISASATAVLTFSGQGGHAGAVMMADRQANAMPAATSFAVACHQLALDAPSPFAVATVGQFSVFPSNSNSIPSQVRLSIDVRDRETAVRDALLQKILLTAEEIAAQHGASLQADILNQDPAAISDPTILTAIEQSASELNLETMRLQSFAYHDTTFMSLICPSAMIFIPCENGYSHRPEEYATPQDIAQGVETLALTLAKLAA